MQIKGAHKAKALISGRREADGGDWRHRVTTGSRGNSVNMRPEPAAIRLEVPFRRVTVTRESGR